MEKKFPPTMLPQPTLWVPENYTTDQMVPLVAGTDLWVPKSYTDNHIKKLRDNYLNHLLITIVLGNLHGYLEFVLKTFSFALTQKDSIVLARKKQEALLDKLSSSKHDLKRSYEMGRNFLQDTEIFTFCFVGLLHKQEEHLKDVFFQTFLLGKKIDENKLKKYGEKTFFPLFEETVKKLSIIRKQPCIYAIKECNALSSMIKHKKIFSQYGKESKIKLEVIEKFTIDFALGRRVFVLWREPFVRYVRAFEDFWWQVFSRLEKEDKILSGIEEMESKVQSSQKKFWEAMEKEHDIKSDEGKLN